MREMIRIEPPVSPVRPFHLLLGAAALLMIGSVPMPAVAQPASAPRLGEAAAIWRVASRLGYWPSNEIVQAIRAHPQGPQGWALDEIDRAFDASRQPAHLPEPFALLAQPLAEVFVEFRRERQERLKIQQTPPAVPGGTAAAARVPGPPMPASMAASTASMAAAPVQLAVPFNRVRAQQAAAWRVLSCSDPALEHPLVARLTEFWFNHLNVFAGKSTVRPFAGHYALGAIRPNILGPYESLLLASARHPAMLFYLDQNQNVAEGSPGPRGTTRGINENYARELMELHTLGVTGGYSQSDVRELARVLTGWTVDPGGTSGFRFVERLHDKDGKTVLGHRFGGDGTGGGRGEREGLDAIAMLAGHPSTARRVAQRLATFFVSDAPSAALVDRLAAEFTAGQGDLRRMLRALVRSPEFWDPASELFKTPYDFACSALGFSAQAGAADTDQQARVMMALRFLAGAGQPVHGWQTPDGYPTDAATWISPESLTRRADLAAALSAGAPDPLQLTGFFRAATREKISRVLPATRAALAVASPDFMRK